MEQDKIRQSFLEANHALLQAHSLIEISQESYTAPESENIYNLIGVLNEKIGVALSFFSNNDLCWKTDKMSKKVEVAGAKE